MMTISTSRHNKSEWLRFAQDCKENGFILSAERFISAADKDIMPISEFVSLQNDYRNWLCFDQYPEVSL